MRDEARVTVVIPAYKAEATIGRAVDSVLAQEGVDVRVVVVVDGVFDGTVERLQRYDPADVTVLVNEENRGVQVSRNRGLEAAEGEFVLFLDSDDYLEGPLLKGLADKLIDGADIAFGPMQRIKEATGKRKPVVHRDYASPEDLFRAWFGQGKTVGTCSIMWRTDFLRRIGGWDPLFLRNEDGEVVIRTILSGGRFALSREGRGMYVDHDSPNRLTRRAETLAAPLDVGEKLLAMESSVVDEETKRRILAVYFYRIALRLDSVGRGDLAARAWRRARDAGFRSSPLLAAHRWAARLIGLPFRLRVLGLDEGGKAAWLLLGIASRNISYASAAGLRRPIAG